MLYLPNAEVIDSDLHSLAAGLCLCGLSQKPLTAVVVSALVWYVTVAGVIPGLSQKFRCWLEEIPVCESRVRTEQCPYLDQTRQSNSLG